MVSYYNYDIHQNDLTFCCADTGGVVIKGLSGTVLVWGVLILGDTYDLGDEASDVKDIGDWLDGWAVKEKKVGFDFFNKIISYLKCELDFILVLCSMLY